MKLASVNGLGEDHSFDEARTAQTSEVHIIVMADRPRLGVALMVLGMIVLIINALFLVAHYVEGWPIPSVSLTIVGMTCVILGIFWGLGAHL